MSEEIKDIRVSGSFTKSKLWLQILTDVLNSPITLPNNSEGAAFGAAVLGFISSGTLKDITDTAHLVHAKKVYTPEEEKEMFGLQEEILTAYGLTRQ